MASTSTDSIEDPAHKAIGSNRSNGAEPNKKRLLGAYYTPVDIATSLTRWALARGGNTVLDPSFGGCAFLIASASILGLKGIGQPGRLVFGIDIDEECSTYVRDHPDLVVENCVYRDFLACSPDDLPSAPFGAIVGNPPFVRHHWLKGDAQAAARASLRDSGVSLPMTASSWAYFLVHSFRFIANGGRLAMLVPEAILQTEYGSAVREALRIRFDEVRLIHIRNRLFDGTDEPVVVVAASGHGVSGTLSVESIQSSGDLDKVLSIAPSSANTTQITTENGRITDNATIELIAELGRHGVMRRMSNLAIARIGFVTGANRHFIVGAKELAQFGFPDESLKPVVPRTGWLSGLEFTSSDHTACAEAGKRAYLVRPEPSLEDDSVVKQWIANGKESGISERQKCTGRDPWFRVVLPPEPHAFATCTRADSPLLIVNRSGYPCSNALHGVCWRDDCSVSPEAVAAGFLTSAVSVWAELNGRRYGGGVLKLEPGTLNRVPVPIWPGVKARFEELDELMRKGYEEQARKIADTVVLGEGLGLSENDIQRLQRARLDLMAHRRPVRNGTSHA